MQELLENIIYLLGTLVYSMASIFEQVHHSFTAVINLIMVALDDVAGKLMVIPVSCIVTMSSVATWGEQA